jgi:YidC/Oxa1 family membrane protein insertase
MDMSAAGGNSQQMKFMMYLQYAFPVIFFFALNSWAAGLTAYMLFSNVLNILQTFITKNYIISKEKVRAQMDENKRNPKVSAWQKRLEEMTKLQQQQKK